MATQIDTLVTARWIVPVEPENTVLEKSAIAINAGRIVDILPTDAALERYSAGETHELGDHVLIPGLVNTHTHAAMTLFRGMADDLPLMTWLQDHIWPAEQQWVAPGFVEDGTRLAIAEMLRGGTTCFNDMYFFPDHAAEVASAIGMRANVGLIVIDFPTPWAQNAGEYIHKGLEVNDRFRNDPLISCSFAPHAPYTVSDQPMRQLATYAEELNLQIHMHVHETAFEVDQAMEQHGQRPLGKLSAMNLLNERLLAVHMTQLDEAEMDLVAGYGVHVVHCPESNLKLASGFCPVDTLLARGVNVALGTDGAASNNDLDMLGEARTAAQIGKAIANDPSAVPAWQTLRMATINGAKALGLDADIGSLEIGKAADIVAVDLMQPATQPVYDPVSQLIYAASRQQVSDVWIAGKQLLRDSELTTIDQEQLITLAEDWRLKINQS
ncbi:5-methylthioadenosine/S-adenosylhomocysteine deaminase [Methylohalomonas lacus]|uniref:5-methylthioadenosine/S-adenosylhomocysteine deaminase n=1 Tax=Methylohalomonas lacus TaxID=398773 RepID=A0AAE3HH96_9GAMM|nr:TRZ/ATZ family hydrolase [Methylohalomonas lacus]MCS3902280.1 5-methylthioadenosine/S-adenosylhomocysteine deaminase [Methylohalomonas lacus]